MPISVRSAVRRVKPAVAGRGRVSLAYEARPLAPKYPEDIDFLARRGVPDTMLASASRRATARGAAASQELIALGFDRKRYWSLLADDLGVLFFDDARGATLLPNAGLLATEAVRLASAMLVRIGDRNILVLAPRPHEIPLLRRRLEGTPALAGRVRIASPETIREVIVAHRHPALTHYAVNRLAHVLPRLSASRGCGKGASGPIALAAAVIAMALVAPLATLSRSDFSARSFS